MHATTTAMTSCVELPCCVHKILVHYSHPQSLACAVSAPSSIRSLNIERNGYAIDVPLTAEPFTVSWCPDLDANMDLRVKMFKSLKFLE